MATVGICGFKGCGKDTAAQYFVDNGFIRESYAGALKDACSCVFNWPRHLLEGDTKESRQWREEVDHWWAQRLNIPHFTPRFALQRMGTEAMRFGIHPDIWLANVQNKINKMPNSNFIITDCRFVNELDLIKNQGGVLIWIRRGEMPTWYEMALDANNGNQYAEQEMLKLDVHESEWRWLGYDVNYIIDNNGSMEDLRCQMEVILQQMNL